MEAFKTSLYNFLNRMINGIYPEQSMSNYNNEKREELNLISEEQSINNSIDEELQIIKNKKINEIKNHLKLHTKIINSIIKFKDNEPNLTILSRIYYILYNLLKKEELFNDNEKLYKLEKYMSSLTYTSPFDNEEIILDRLIELCNYLEIYFPNNSSIKKFVEEDLYYIPLTTIIKNIVDL